MKVRIYYHHTDCGGVVYYGNYLNFLEEARTELMENKIKPLKELVAEGILFVVSRQEIDYKAPAVYGDVLEIDTRVTSVGAAKMEFEYDIKNQNNRIISKAKTILVCVDNKFRPRAIPEEIKNKLR